MKHLSIPIAFIIAVIFICFLLMSPSYLSDFIWMIVAIPIATFVIHEFYDYVPSLRRQHRVTYAIEPMSETDEQDEAADDNDAVGIAGLWVGTVRIWPSASDEVVQIVPITLMISEPDKNVKVIENGTSESETRINDVKVIEYDPTTGNVDLALTVVSHYRQRIFETQLCLGSHTMLPEDETDLVTIELKRAVLKTVTLSYRKPEAALA